MIFGLAERLRTEIHHMLDQPVRPLGEAALERVRCELDPADFAAAWERGHALSLRDGIVQLLECMTYQPRRQCVGVDVPNASLRGWYTAWMTRIGNSTLRYRSSVVEQS